LRFDTQHWPRGVRAAPQGVDYKDHVSQENVVPFDGFLVGPYSILQAAITTGIIRAAMPLRFKAMDGDRFADLECGEILADLKWSAVGSSRLRQ